MTGLPPSITMATHAPFGASPMAVSSSFRQGRRNRSTRSAILIRFWNARISILIELTVEALEFVHDQAGVRLTALLS